MPLDLIGAVLAAPDPDARNSLIGDHLAHLERELIQTHRAVTSLRDLLDPPAGGSRSAIGRRRVQATPSAAITDLIDVQDAQGWYQGALGELHAAVAIQGLAPTGCPGGIFADELFTEERGSATVFVPCRHAPRSIGRVTALTVPAAELATISHVGTHQGIDRAYGELAAYVARHALTVRGPIREYYRVSRQDTPDESTWQTEIGWPIFQTNPSS